MPCLPQPCLFSAVPPKGCLALLPAATALLPALPCPAPHTPSTRRAERQLMSYEREGWVEDEPARLTGRLEVRPAAELGPIIVCLDTSGACRLSGLWVGMCGWVWGGSGPYHCVPPPRVRLHTPQGAPGGVCRLSSSVCARVAVVVVVVAVVEEAHAGDKARKR